MISVFGNTEINNCNFENTNQSVVPRVGFISSKMQTSFIVRNSKFFGGLGTDAHCILTSQSNFF